MRFTPVSCEEREFMLEVVGVSGTDELFTDVPAPLRLDRVLDLPEAMSEMELSEHLGSLARLNAPASGLVSFMGAGCYDHYIPAIVDHVLRKPEFFTAYTPYQPEVSQGTLQAIFEYQTMICELTGLDVANASMYDGATAMVEAALMAARSTKRSRVLVSDGIHPEWRRTLATYSSAGACEVDSIPLADGRTSIDHGSVLAAWLAADDAKDVAAVVIGSPNYLGSLEEVARIAEAAHEAGALLIVAANPVLLGVVEPPGALGADIVVGEGQPLGNTMSFGGPGLGFFACREALVRQMPGRLVGKTVDADGNDGYVLTLSTREQHIRREKATSNICSNHALNALAAAVHLSALGAGGLEQTASVCVARAHYMRERLLESGKFREPWSRTFGYEFALEYLGDVAEMQEAMLEGGFLAGVRVSDIEDGWSAAVEDELASRLVLFAVTEKRSRAEIDAFVEEVRAL